MLTREGTTGQHRLRTTTFLEHAYGLIATRSNFLSLENSPRLIEREVALPAMTYAAVEFTLSNRYQQVEMCARSWLSPLSYTGGLFDFLFLLGTFLTTNVSSFFYQASLIKRLYRRNGASDAVVR